MRVTKRFFKDNNAISDVVGVILMVATIVAIAATVYVYVSNAFIDKEVVICGKITYFPVSFEWERYGVVGFDDGSFYSINSLGDDDYSMMKFAFEANCTVSLVLVHYYDSGYNVKDGSVTLLDCGCQSLRGQ